MKYRAYDKSKNQFLDPNTITIYPYGKLWEHIDGGFAIHSDAVIQLSTGVKDTSGKEIFEGDIIETLNDEEGLFGDLGRYKNGKVVFINATFRIQERYVGATELGAYLTCGCCNQSTLKVIGNIFNK